MTQNTDYDLPWKEALERYFPNFMQLLFAEAYASIDWTQPYECLAIHLIRDKGNNNR